MSRTSSNLRKHYAGCYRATLDAERFVQIRRVARRADGTYEPQSDGRYWSNEIRATASGDLLQFAGVYGTLDEAFRASGAPLLLVDGAA